MHSSTLHPLAASFVFLLMLSVQETTGQTFMSLNVTDVRLVNGSASHNGRVEFNILGVWGTICDDSFNINAAKVICSMLNLQASAFATGARFGQGIGPVFAQRVSCAGSETHLNQCTFMTTGMCTHGQDVGVFCTACGEVDIAYGEGHALSADGRDLTIACDEGFSSDITSTTCQNGIWTVPSITCVQEIIKGLRLGGGTGLYDGRVEVLVNNTWGAVCVPSQPPQVAQRFAITVCDILFGTRSYRTYNSDPSRYIQGATNVAIDSLTCTGSETDLNECAITIDGSCTNRYFNLACRVKPLNITNTRLVNGTGPYDGRYEMMVDGQWGTVCNRYVGLYDARTFCNMMNLSLAAYFKTTVYGKGSGPVLIQEVRCHFYARDDISMCFFENPHATICSHAYDLSIVCTDCGIPNIINGEGVSFNGSELTVRCQEGYQPETVTMTCLANGSWIQDQFCTPFHAYPLNITDLRLQQSGWLFEGRVEIQVNASWGTICARNVNETAADTVCKMLGLKYVKHYTKALEDSLYRIGQGPIYIDELVCEEDDTHINECSYDLSNDCTHYEDLAVVCTGYQMNITGIRLALADSLGLYHGRVEIEVNNTWGTIGHIGVSWNEAHTFCRMFGLSGAYKYLYSSYYGPGSGPKYIQKFVCPSTAWHINDCKYEQTDDSAVNDHGQDVSVICYGPVLNITDVRLVNGTGPFDGRAEIKVDDTWGTICDNNFDITAADKFCNYHGLRAVQIFTGALYGEGSGPIYIDQAFCKTDHANLEACPYIYLNSCSHEMDISIVCNECGQPDIAFWGAGYFTFNGSTLFADCSFYRNYIGFLRMTCDNNTREWTTAGECQEYSYPLDVTDIRLAGGSNSSSGRVEIKSLDTWGTVCNDSFGMEEANLICKLIGYPHAVTFFSGTQFGEGWGPIFVDDLTCPFDAEGLNNCMYNTFDNCNHEKDVSVVCTDCGDPTPTHGSINSSDTYVGSVVHITCDDHYELIGDADIVCQMDGKWSSTGTCSIIDCGDPTPENGKSNTTATINGTVVVIECNEGHNIIGDSVLKCFPNRTWSDNTTCQIIDCGYLSPQNADVAYTNSLTTVGESAVISCRSGYEVYRTTSQTVTCLSNGTWEQWSNCLPVDCGDPTPYGGSTNATNTTYGNVVMITCDPTFNITGDSIIVCQAGGTWSDTPTCSASDCGNMAVANGDIDLSQGTLIGALATITCDQGYTLNGFSVVRCTATGWNDSMVSCMIQTCDDPTPSNGEVTNTDATGDYVYGDFAVIECNTGYELKGDEIITCVDGGVWSDNSTCSIKDCGILTPAAYGDIDDSQGTEFGAIALFSCNEGFLLVGESHATCDENGEWTNDTPTCVKKSDIGEMCRDGSYCLYENARCINSVCTCITGLYDSSTKKCDIMPLLPYGESEGDTAVSKEKMCGPKVTFEPGFPTNGNCKKHETMSVCWNGYVELDTVVQNQNNIIAGNVDFLAPFSGTINIDQSAGLYFRSYNIRDSYKEMKENAEVVSYINNIVRKFANDTRYEAAFVLIATWDKVKTSDAGFDPTKSATFQAVLTSDGATTYVFYIYGHGKMKWEWNENVSNHPSIWVGFSVAHDVYEHPYSNTNAVLQLDSSIETGTSDDDVAGIVFKALAVRSNECSNPAADCVNWYNKNYENKEDIDLISNLMPECPCDILLSRFDPWFWRIGLQRNRKDVIHACVEMDHVAMYGHYGKTCCYDVRSWLLVYERPYAGGFQMYTSNSKFALKHIVNDKKPKVDCCNKSDNCNLYYEVRPIGNCYKTSPYDFGLFWGDPHFKTLDGLNFTFNGLGEYTLLQIFGEYTFDLQARTGRPLKENGDLSVATVFTAFAARDSTNASVHIELNKKKKGVNLYGNKRDLTTHYNKSRLSGERFEWTSDENNLIISERADTLVVFFPSFGISLTIAVAEEMLSLNTLVNTTLHGKTKGLLGNYNGDPHDDFIFPNGSRLSSDISESEVYEYGNTWEIDEDNSAFIYDAGKSHSDFQNNSYVPKFLDEADPGKVKEAEGICNGTENIQCVFDLTFTEKVEVAINTNKIKEISDKDKNELGESVPSISGCELIKVNKGQQASCSFTAEGGDDVYFISNNVNATIDSEASLLFVTLGDENTVDVRIAARNKNNRSSTAFIVDVLLCTKCSGHGTCTDKPREDARNSEYYKIATCECEPQSEGSDCERDFDGCVSNPCSLNRQCTKLSARDQKLLGRAYNCSACPGNGYITSNVNDCLDIDECAEGTDNCQHICTNTDGSFQCSCRTGFKVDNNDPSKCRDKNECEEGTHDCTHICNNTDGSFNCQCYPGYEMYTDSGECVASADGGCEAEDQERCKNAAGCTLDNGSPVCFCKNGYILDESGTKCNDIDECESGICPHECANTDGGFQCMCYDGFMLEDRVTCKECDVLHSGKNCMQNCVCTGRGANRCDNVRGCICDAGWQGVTCNEDIDVCATSEQVCDDPRKECVNNLGSYSCQCLQGFYETDRGTCEATNECLDPRLNDCEQICENTFGSYYCACKDGYTKNSDNSCKDIDECALGLAQCEQLCTNDPGGYTCSCHLGYTLSDDRHNCIKLEDLCLERSNLTCEHYCLIENSVPKCSCRQGYILESDDQQCTDLNECELLTNPCGEDATCTNTEGSYLCSCPIGTKLENDGRTCTECDAYHFGMDCLQECKCLYGTCDKETGCLCYPGWGGEYCDVDIDECGASLLECTTDHTVCVNILGSASCSCKEGYSNVSGVCQDIDECTDNSLNSCDQICINTDGSYLCSCHQGFTGRDKCNDINECSGSHECDQTCENTVGSYKCVCEEGFKLDLTNRKACKAKHECSSSEESTCPENSFCFKTNDQVECTCKKGYKKSEDGRCTDINECSEDHNQCSDECTNTAGSFKCICDTGRYLLGDGVTCAECQQGRFGDNCSSECSCNVANTRSCDAESGACECKTGWTGDLCKYDLDECENSNTCDVNSLCRNSLGSYFCICNSGFFMSGNGICEECDTRHYGNNCLQKCSCHVENTADCNHVDGTCECKQGWKGESCDKDINECLEVTGVCNDKPNSRCENTEGSYACVCSDGYREQGDMCIDIDECTTGSHDCLQECTNTGGSYTCACFKGYTGTNNDCKECTGNTHGIGCLQQCDCQSRNTKNEVQTCNHITGQCECKANWNGDKCTEDVNECEDQTICNAQGNTTCVNTRGWYNCECVRGFKANAEGVCKEDPAQVPDIQVVEGEIRIVLTVRIDVNLPEGTNLMSAKTYQRIKQPCVESLLGLFARFGLLNVQVMVTDIRTGSIVVDYVVVAKDTTDTTLSSKLASVLVELENGTSVNYDGEDVHATTNMYEGLEPCEVLERTVKRCSEGLKCTVENGVPICVKTENGWNVNWALTVGLIGGCILFVILITILLLCLWRNIRKKPKANERTYRGFDNYNPGVYDDDATDYYRTQEWRGGQIHNIGLRSPSLKENAGRMWTHGSTLDTSFDQPYHFPNARKSKRKFKEFDPSYM